MSPRRRAAPALSRKYNRRLPTRRRACELGDGRAITASARELACLIYTLVTRGEEYVERGIETYEQRRVDRSV